MTIPASAGHGPIKVEVKSGGYLQDWKQSAYSKIVFSRFKAWGWTHESGMVDIPPDYHADVYVFALHICKDPEKLDLLDLSQWEFRVLPRRVLLEHGVKSLSWDKVRKLTPTGLGWTQLADAVRSAHSGGS